jgi:hypothetical protein
MEPDNSGWGTFILKLFQDSLTNLWIKNFVLQTVHDGVSRKQSRTVDFAAGIPGMPKIYSFDK